MASYKVENIESVDELLDNKTNEDVGIEPMIFAPDEPRVTINERILDIPDELKTIGVENDNNVERIYFEIPRYFDEVNDLSEFTIYINYLNANQEPNKYHCTDVEVEGENIVFSWLTSEHVYSYRGTVRFIVYAVASDNRKWNSTVAELFVMEGLETEEQIIDNNPDIIDELINMKPQVENALEKINEQQDVIEQQQNTIEEQQSTITEQQKDIEDTINNLNTKIENGDFTPEFTIGDVETVEPSVPAEVNQTGTQLDPILNFKIPRGATNVVDNLDGTSVAEAPSQRTVKEALAKHIELDGNIISTDKNWNDLEINKIYLTSGTYKTSNNAPIDGDLGGMLIYASVTNGAIQLYLPRLETGKIYLRGKYSSAWRDWICVQDYNNLINKPTSMKNPKALTFTGGVTGTYDGSSAKTVNIPTKLPANGGNASTVGEVGISDIVQKSLSGLLKFPTKSSNGLTIGLTNGVGNGKIELINNYSDASDATNLPISQMIAIKQTFIASSTIGMVRLYELWPVRGRVWQNEYNGTSSSSLWAGWKLVQGEYQIWSGSTTEGNSIGQTGNYVDLDMFKKLKVVTNGTAMILPIGSDNIAWGSAITVGGSNERYLCSVKLTLNKSNNQLSVNVCSQLTYPNNSPTKMTLTRIIGLP